MTMIINKSLQKSIKSNIQQISEINHLNKILKKQDNSHSNFIFKTMSINLKRIKFQTIQQIIMQDRKIKQFNQKASCVKEYAYLEDRNYPTRQSMEDNHFAIDAFNKQLTSGLFSILDGHGGSQVVQYCAKVTPEIFIKQYAKQKKNIYQLFENVFKKVDDQLKLVGASESGSTCCLVLVRKNQNNKKICYVANLGDTRAVLCINQNTAKRVTIDHKVSNLNQQQRVKKAGGVIVRGRVSGQLAITRALGDLDLKTQGVICTPDLQEFEINNSTSFLIIASDGLWDVCEDQKAVDLVKKCSTSEEMCKILVEYALKNGSKDNISVLILKFN